MHGNVSEWCEDGSRERLPGGKDPHVEGEPLSSRIVRGGSWINGAYSLRSAARGGRLPWAREEDVGFRLILEKPEG